MVLELHSYMSASLVSLHCHIRWRNELLASLLVHLGETCYIGVAIDLSYTTDFSPIASWCLLGIIVYSGRLLNIVALWLLANDIEHTCLKALLVSGQEVLFPIIIISVHV